jgi:hypothetical protein
LSRLKENITTITIDKKSLGNNNKKPLYEKKQRIHQCKFFSENEKNIGKFPTSIRRGKIR